VLQGYEHGWFGGEQGEFSVPEAPDVSKMIWSFFARHPRPARRSSAAAARGSVAAAGLKSA